MNVVFKIGKWGDQDAPWTVTCFSGRGIWIARYLTGDDALGAVRMALDSGFFLAYPAKRRVIL